MSKTGIRFNCPRCRYEINVDKVLSHELENEIRKEYESREDKLKERLSFILEKEKNINKRILFFPN